MRTTDREREREREREGERERELQQRGKKPSMKSWSRVHKLAALLLLPPSKWEHVVYRTCLAFRP